MAKREIPVKKNEMITLTFEDLTHEGNGVGKINGYPLFVQGGLPGEEAEVKVVKANKNAPNIPFILLLVLMIN